MKEFFSKLTAALLAAAVMVAFFPAAVSAQAEASRPLAVTRAVATPTDIAPDSSDDLKITFGNGGNSMDTAAVNGITARAEITGNPYEDIITDDSGNALNTGLWYAPVSISFTGQAASAGQYTVWLSSSVDGVTTAPYPIEAETGGSIEETLDYSVPFPVTRDINENDTYIYEITDLELHLEFAPMGSEPQPMSFAGGGDTAVSDCGVTVTATLLGAPTEGALGAGGWHQLVEIEFTGLPTQRGQLDITLESAEHGKGGKPAILADAGSFFTQPGVPLEEQSNTVLVFFPVVNGRAVKIDDLALKAVFSQENYQVRYPVLPPDPSAYTLNGQTLEVSFNRDELPAGYGLTIFLTFEGTPEREGVYQIELSSEKANSGDLIFNEATGYDDHTNVKRGFLVGINIEPPTSEEPMEQITIEFPNWWEFVMPAEPVDDFQFTAQFIPYDGGDPAPTPDPEPAPVPTPTPRPQNDDDNSDNHDTSSRPRTAPSASPPVKLSDRSTSRYHDTVKNGAVEVRLYIDDPSLFPADAYVSAHTTGAAADRIRGVFEKWFTNKVRTIHFDQTGGWENPVKVAAKLDLTGMDTTNLVLYAYDPKTNTYLKLEAPAYWIDANGYVHFTTGFAGETVIAGGELERR